MIASLFINPSPIIRIMIASLTIWCHGGQVFDHCLYFNTTALARLLEREWTAAFAAFELTPPQAFMLRLVLDQPGLASRAPPDQLAVLETVQHAQADPAARGRHRRPRAAHPPDRGGR